jgi:flagellar biosynthesis protein FlhB
MTCIVGSSYWIRLFVLFLQMVFVRIRTCPTYFTCAHDSGSFSINSTKLKDGLKSTLGSFIQFLFTNINFSKLTIFKQYLKKIVSTPTKEKIPFVSIWNSTMINIWLVKKPIMIYVQIKNLKWLYLNNLKWKKKKKTFILIGMFNFLKQILKSSWALFHSCLPFPNFFGQIIHFYKFDWIKINIFEIHAHVHICCQI